MTTFKLTQEEYDTLLFACRPVQLVGLQCGDPVLSQRETIKLAWERIAESYLVKYDSIKPSPLGDMHFEAEEI